MSTESLNQVRQLRAGQGVSAVRQYLQALYEETKERWVEASAEQEAALKAEARLLKRLHKEFGDPPEETQGQHDGAYS